MNEINQAIEALERCIAEPEAKPWHDINIALTALRSLPGPATEEEMFICIAGKDGSNVARLEELAFRAAERRIFGE